MKEILTQWNVLEQTICIVTDNAASMLNILKIRNLPYFAHTINLVIQDGLKMNDDQGLKVLFAKCRRIVRFSK